MSSKVTISREIRKSQSTFFPALLLIGISFKIQKEKDLATKTFLSSHIFPTSLWELMGTRLRNDEKPIRINLRPSTLTVPFSY